VRGGVADVPRYPRLFEPLVVRGQRLRNRIVSTAHNPNWDADGVISEKHVRYHVRKARGGAGLVMTFGSASVHQQAGAFPDSIRLWDPDNEPALRELARGVHEHGAVVMSQASHLGHRGNSLISGRPLQAPSEVPQPVRREIPHVLKVREIREIVGSFAEAARRLERCGWDGIEITSFGGHLIEQFWSPRINLRDDAYGGDFESRMRFSIEVVEAVGEAVGEGFIVAFRLTGDPLYDVIGLDAADMRRIAERLDAVGRIDFFNVSGGTGNTLESQAATVPGDMFPRGLYLPAARAMKERLRVPVLSAGRILDLDQAEAALEAGDCDLVAMTRAIIADPDLPNKALAGDAGAIRPCIAINEGCIGRDYQGLPMLCSVNPAVAWPELDDYGPAGKKEKVVVVGGGPAGMEAARVSAQRGHTVVLLERSQRLGGQVATAARAPERPHLGRHVAWLGRELKRLGVDVRLGVDASAETVLALEPGAVVIATGAENGLPREAAGVQSRCVTDVDLLEGREKVEPGQKVVVYDPEGLNRGGSIANLAAEAGAAVELATPLLAVCQDLDPTQQPGMMRRLARNRVVTSPNQLLQPPEGGRLVLRHAWSDAERAVEADLLVFVGYRHASSGLEDDLQAARPDLEVRMVGDCLAPRRLHDAVAEGVRAGTAIGSSPPAG
jgi:2,4-dienoyl-CoA reductase-like NADH-dependent reductase (Old Yellow Enzyme family)